MISHQFQKSLMAIFFVSAFVNQANTSQTATKYPWIVKPQEELTKTECKAAMRHDSSYWWAGGKCHMKMIRYAWGVAIRDTAAKENPSSIMKQGALLTAIAQYRENEGTYCEHGGYCYPAKDIKLLGSILTGHYDDSAKPSDDSYSWKAVSASCETILADRKNIIAANAQAMLKDCH
jgi:hypothetical protein